MARKDELGTCFESIGAIWKHDGNPARPYAELTSGKISDSFYNGSKVIERPFLLSQVVEVLLSEAVPHLPAEAIDVVVGPAMGAVTLAYEVARQLGPHARAWFAEPSGEGRKLIIKRFEPNKNIRRALVVEDTITTGGSTVETINAIHALDPTIEVVTPVLCVVNRSGSLYLTSTPHRIVSVVLVNAKAWKRGDNPYTADGNELVEPVRPKANWGALNRAYP